MTARMPDRAAARMRRVVIGLPAVWMTLCFLLPLLIVAAISLGDARLGQPPVGWGPDWPAAIAIDLESFRRIVENPLYAEALLGSLRQALLATALTLLIGYPMALAIARSRETSRNILLLLVILPFWTSFLLRVYAWMGLLGAQGPVNGILMSTGVIDTPLRMLNTDGAMLVGLVYTYLPFMILPLYASLARMDEALSEAARDLGATPRGVFLDVTLPLSLPGVVAGSMLVFAPVMGEFVVPTLLGRADSPMIGRVLADEFFLNRDWPVASAVALCLLLVVAVPLALLNRYLGRETGMGGGA